MTEFKPITTQEELNAILADRLKRQKDSLLKKYENYDTVVEENNTLREQLSTKDQTLEKSNEELAAYQSKIDDLTGELSQQQLSSLKTTIALQHGIPYNLAGRLQGEDEESIIEDAKSISSFIAQNEPVAPLKSTEPQQINSEDAAYKSLLENLNIEGE